MVKGQRISHAASELNRARRGLNSLLGKGAWIANPLTKPLSARVSEFASQELNRDGRGPPNGMTQATVTEWISHRRLNRGSVVSSTWDPIHLCFQQLSPSFLFSPLPETSSSTGPRRARFNHWVEKSTLFIFFQYQKRSDHVLSFYFCFFRWKICDNQSNDWVKERFFSTGSKRDFFRLGQREIFFDWVKERFFSTGSKGDFFGKFLIGQTGKPIFLHQF